MVRYPVFGRFRFDVLHFIILVLSECFYSPYHNRLCSHSVSWFPSGISYDAPKDPEELAKIRHERIRNEKKQVNNWSTDLC